MNENPPDLQKSVTGYISFLNQADFHLAIQQEKKSCKLVHASEPSNQAEKLVCVNYPKICAC